MNEDTIAQLPPGQPANHATECLHYDFNEGGGMGPDGRDHCHSYQDRDDPFASGMDEPGTFTKRARSAAWIRAFWQVAIALTTGRKTGYQRSRAKR